MLIGFVLFLDIWRRDKQVVHATNWSFCLHIFIVYSYLGFIFFLPLQSFTRLAELVLQANKKDLDLLGGSMNEEFNLAVLEEQEGLCNGSDNTSKSCWCWGQEVTFFQLISMFMMHLHFEYFFSLKKRRSKGHFSATAHYLIRLI